MILNPISRFYDYFYQINYRFQKKVTSDPEVFPTFIVSFCQAANVLLILIVIYFVTNLKPIVTENFLQYSFVILLITFSAINFHRYILGKEAKIFNSQNQLEQLKKNVFYILFILSLVYVVISIWLPFLAIYYFNEHY